MTFIRIRKKTVGFDWIWKPGDVIDIRDDPNYWAYWVDNGTAEYITATDEIKTIKVRSRSTKKQPVVRPLKQLDDLSRQQTKIKLPEEGSFNAGLAPFKDHYCMVYRPTETSFIGCLLTEKFKAFNFHSFQTNNCADPRLIWFENKLYMFYSSFNDQHTMDKECIRGQLVMENDEWVDYEPFRVSPPDLPRQKNWMPFEYNGRLLFIADVCPHRIYEWNGTKAELAYQNDWLNPWFYESQLRGNTNAARLDSGDYLATFHTAQQLRYCCYYDNGSYLFEGKPPFRVLKCANKSYLPAEAAIEKPFRKANIIQCNFPVGLVVEGKRVLISYGDSDSVVKIMETTVNKMLSLMIDVY